MMLSFLIEFSCRSKSDVAQKPITDYLEKDDASESLDELSIDNKKMLTKGAMKIFEGLKVSIPTDDLDMTEVLNCSPTTKAIITNGTKTESEKKVKTPLNKFGNKLGLKVTKKKNLQNRRSPKSNKNCDKVLDIYDFEETQDNTDVFTSNITDLKTFRTQSKIVDKKNKSAQDSFTYEVESLSSFSTESSDTLKKSKLKNITKKKCMIMGRIFKNAFKSKCDDPVEDLPTVDHSKLVEEYVIKCSTANSPDEKKPSKITNVEMDMLFDRLLQETPNSVNQSQQQQQQEGKKPTAKIKKISKNRKRRNEDSSDDEFNINKGPRKRNMKKNNKADDGINLELELKECIGVASRKSQRKCTSGKQNVLVEYWSSDESSFETFLEELTASSPTVNQVNPITETLPSIPEKVVENDPVNKLEETISSDINKKRKVSVPKRKKLLTNKQKLNNNRQDKQFKKPIVTQEVSVVDSLVATRKKRNAADTLYYWSSSSDDELGDMIEVKPIREEDDDDEDRPMQHGWIVGDSPKKLVTMLAQAKGKKTDADCVKEQGKKRTTV